MKYVALLRGINVGGNNKVDMKLLKASFEHIGMQDVSTYINTGNIIFKDDSHGPNELAMLIESMIEKDFGLAIKVLVRSKEQIDAVAAVLPSDWTNDPKNMKSDVMFLWGEVDSPKVLDNLTRKDNIDTVLYVPGALLWSVARKDQLKSGMQKLPGTKLYKQMTIRNVNTFRKIHTLMCENV